MKHLSVILLFAVVLAGALFPAGSCAATDADKTGFIVVTNPPVADFYTSNQYGSAPFTVSFFEASRGSGPMTYRWDFGDGTSSGQQNPAHTYKVDGDYTISLTVTNQYGSDTKTVKNFIGVGNPPAADYAATPTRGDFPLTVQFTDKSKNRPTSWQWDFGDGATSNERNPVHTYTQAASYPVTLRVSNPFGSDGLTKTGYIAVSGPAPVPAVTPAPEPAGTKKLEGFPGLVQEARGPLDKALPTSGLIPPQFMALAAVITSIAILAIQIILANIGVIWQFLLKFAKFFSDLFFGHAVEKLSEKEIELRRIEVRRMEPHFLGLSSTEVLVIEIAVIIVALAFMLADRAELTLEMVVIYVIVGAISVILHDFAHRYIATKHGQDADTQFWGLGTGIMFLTAWLFGNAFGASYRNLVHRNDDDDPGQIGSEMVAGPVVSIVLTFVFLGMVMLGGIWAVAGGIGFVINLITAVYSLMPIETMDGLAIWRWNKGLYLALLVPIFLFYCYTFMLVE